MRLLTLALALLLAFAAACSDNPPDAPVSDSAADSPEAIVQLTRQWSADVQSIEMQFEVEVQLFGDPSRFRMTVAAQGDDSYALVSMPAPAADEGGPVRLEVLTLGERVYTRETDAALWADVTDDEFWLAGVDLELLAGSTAFDWSALDGVVVAPGEHEGVDVWIVEYGFELSDINAEEEGLGGALGPAAELLLGSFDLPTELIGVIGVRTLIARDSGAPLLSEVEVALDGPSGVDADRAVVATTTLTAWNQSFEFPEVGDVVDAVDADPPNR